MQKINDHIYGKVKLQGHVDETDVVNLLKLDLESEKKFCSSTLCSIDNQF